MRSHATARVVLGAFALGACSTAPSGSSVIGGTAGAGGANAAGAGGAATSADASPAGGGPAGASDGGAAGTGGVTSTGGGAGAGGAGGQLLDGGPQDGPHDLATDRSAEAGETSPPGKQVLIWVWQSYASTLASVAANAKSFTHVSPALYQINYAYQSGVAKLVNGNDNFDGLTSKQVTQKIHDAGLKSVPLMYGGSGNSGTDQGIQNVLNDAPAGARQSFIDSMVAEAKAKGHDGYNLDWEVDDTGYAAYGAKLIAFLTSFKGALNAAGLTLSFDLGGWYVRQCSSSGGDGLVDLAQLQHSVDLAIIEDYAGAFGSATATCPATSPKTEACDGDFLTQLGVMCNLPRDVVSIGVISPGTNPFAADALAAVTRWGWRNVAVWPDADQFLDASKMPAGATWYSVLASWLAQ